MQRINSTIFSVPARHPHLVAVAVVCLLVLAGCGGGEDKEPVGFEDVPSKADTTPQVIFRFDTGGNPADSEGADTAPASDAAIVDGDEFAPDGISDVESNDATDAGPVPITTCAGSCGIKLEANACHCDHACGQRGDCCADFDFKCGCATLADCDDGNACTTDSCVQSLDGKKRCKQLPFFGCCNADSECGTPGKNQCVTPRCVQGSCSDVTKDCDDGIPCTKDGCEPATGSCQHEVLSTKCLIDGGCVGAGQPKPNSGGCLFCQPDKLQDGWSAKQGSCFIDGICAKTGEKASPLADECRVCVSSKATDAWSVASGSCYIGGACYASGTKNPANPTCASCQPSKSGTTWSGVSGKCAVGSNCYNTGEGDPALACAVCEPSKSASSLTPKAGFCVIDGTCVAAGASKPGAFGCQTCVPVKSISTWTATKPATVCVDDDPCTIETICTISGQCKGKTQLNCCKTDAECVGKVVLASCDKAMCKGTGECAAVKNPLCCSTGKCCDSLKQQLRPQRTQCSNFAVGSIDYAYKCESGKLFYHEYFPGCTGKVGEANKCSSALENVAKGPWKLEKDCAAATKSCQVSADGKLGLCK